MPPKKAPTKTAATKKKAAAPAKPAADPKKAVEKPVEEPA